MIQSEFEDVWRSAAVRLSHDECGLVVQALGYAVEMVFFLEPIQDQWTMPPERQQPSPAV